MSSLGLRNVHDNDPAHEAMLQRSVDKKKKQLILCKGEQTTANFLKRRPAAAPFFSGSGFRCESCRGMSVTHPRRARGPVSGQKAAF